MMDTETPAENHPTGTLKIYPSPILHAGINLGYGHEDAGYRDDLESFWRGEHDTASGPITIHNAKLVPEPIGALFSETSLLPVSEKQLAAQENHLIIDLGYFTSDWLTLYQLSPDLGQSGGIDIGMHHLLKELSSLLAARYGHTDSDLVTLESLLLEQILHPERFDKDALPLHAMAHEAAETVFAPMIDNLRASVRSWTASSTRAKSILITGGAASFIEKLVKQSWPHIPARVADNAQMANAHSYMEMACMIFSD